jgi:hypothetical protein
MYRYGRLEMNIRWREGFFRLWIAVVVVGWTVIASESTIVRSASLSVADTTPEQPQLAIGLDAVGWIAGLVLGILIFGIGTAWGY